MPEGRHEHYHLTKKYSKETAWSVDFKLNNCSLALSLDAEPDNNPTEIKNHRKKG